MTVKIIPTSFNYIREMFNFYGRMGWKPYLVRQAICGILMLSVMITTMNQLFILIKDGQYPYQGLVILTLAGLLITLSIAMLAQITKRVRDIGWPVWAVPAFFVGNVVLGLIAAKNATPGHVPPLLILLNIFSLAAGIALLLMPSKKLEFPDTIYARKPSELVTITEMLEQIPDAGGNSFITFILPNENASYGPDEMTQAKLIWANISDHVTQDKEASITILRRDATDTIIGGKNMTEDRMWIAKHQGVWEMMPDEIIAAMN